MIKFYARRLLILTKVFVVLCLLSAVLCSGSSSYAAPSLIKGRPDPLERPGTPLRHRLAAKMAPAFFAPAVYPAAVNILFLKVDFQAATGQLTTGNGTWSDPAYAYANQGNDYWVTKDEHDFVAYYKEVSNGLLTINVTVSSKVYRLPNAMAFYGSESNAALQNLIYDSITAAKNDFNFSSYDAVLIVHAGAGEESDVNSDSSNDIWSLYYSDPSGCISQNARGTNCLSITLADGKQIHEAVIMPQTDSQDGITADPFGVYVHEFGHWLGLPDLYCTATICLLDGLGEWSLMADGIYNADPALCPNRMNLSNCVLGSAPAHLDAWSKTFLGWASPQVPAVTSDPGQISLNPIENTMPPSPGSVTTEMFKLLAVSDPPISGPTVTKQYFLIENRQQLGFDRGLPGHGLLVWLVNDAVINNNLATNTVENSPYSPGIKLIEADGDFSLLTTTGDIGSAGDPFPGSTNNRSLTPITKPSSVSYTRYGWVNLTSISEIASTVTFTAGFATLPPTGVSAGNGIVSWNTTTGAMSYNVYKNMGAPVSVTTNSYTDSSPATGDVYRITALDANGNESDFGGLWPVISVSPMSLNFSSGVSSLTVAASNAGSATADLVLKSIAITGANAGEFTASQNCLSLLLVPGSSCTITVTFTPSSAGQKSAILTILSNDPSMPEKDVLLAGINAGTDSGSGGGGGCFVATAAYGSYLDPHVQVLRDFRDRCLLNNEHGKAFVNWYYRTSPPVAAFIARHDAVRTATRLALTPIVYTVQYPSVSTMILSGAAASLCGVVAIRRRRRGLSYREKINL